MILLLSNPQVLATLYKSSRTITIVPNNLTKTFHFLVPSIVNHRITKLVTYRTMYLKALILTAFAAASIIAVPTVNDARTCGTPEPTEEQLQISGQMAIQEAQYLAENGTRFKAQAAINVNVYFHVVATAKTVAGGYLTVNKSQTHLNLAIC
jgi:hypothetical protein